MRAVALFIAVLSTLARAQQTDRAVESAITIQGRDDCIDASALAPQIAHFLGRDRIASRVAVVVRPNPASDELDVLRDGTLIGQRTLAAGDASCEQRRAALGLMIALAVDATLLDDLRPPEPLPIAMIGVDASGWLGLLPEAGAGGWLRVELALTDWLGVEAAALGAVAPDVALATGSVSSALIGGRLALCPVIRVPPLSVAGCGGLGLGAVLAGGHGFTRDLGVVLPWVALAVGAAVRYALSPSIALRLGLDLAVPFVTPELAVTGAAGEDLGVVRSAPAAGSASLGVAFAIY